MEVHYSVVTDQQQPEENDPVDITISSLKKISR